MRPFSKFTVPYYENYGKLVEYNGAARDVPTVKPEEVDEVRIGFLGPVENHPDQRLGNAMLHGAQLAIEEANARGAYGGKPFKLMVHNDQAIWGASSNEMVKLAYDDKVWAMLGSISGDSTHIALRVSLKAEVPIVNSAATDPTIPETIIPWYLTTIQDDRVQGYTLARRIYTDLGLKKVALLRVNDRYGRFGVIKFKDASRRLGHPVLIEQKYLAGDTDFRRALRIINESGADGIVLWGDAAPAGTILKQMREMGMKQRVFGSFRVLGDDLLRNAGDAAEGLEIVFPFDPTRDDPAWLAFNQRFEKRFGSRPDVFASLAYDTMNILLQAVCRAGLNRGKIRDALTAVESYKGVTGDMVFDPNCKNMVPMYLATVRGGKYQFRRYPMQVPYAKVGEDGVQYNGPPLADVAGRRDAHRHLRSGCRAVSSPGFRRCWRRTTDATRWSPCPSDVPWGKASTGLVKLIYDQRGAGADCHRPQLQPPGGAACRQVVRAADCRLGRPHADLGQHPVGNSAARGYADRRRAVPLSGGRREVGTESRTAATMDARRRRSQHYRRLRCLRPSVKASCRDWLNERLRSDSHRTKCFSGKARSAPEFF